MQRSVSSPGLRWIVLAVVVRVPWTRQRWALPFLCVLATTPRGQRASGHPPQNPGAAGPPSGQSAAALAAGSADQAAGRPGLQHPGTRAALCPSADHADCAVSPGLGDPPAGSGAHAPTPWGALASWVRAFPPSNTSSMTRKRCGSVSPWTGMAKANGRWSCVPAPPAGIALARLPCPFGGSSPATQRENDRPKPCFPPTRRSLLKRSCAIS